jgi:phage-related protein
MILPKPIRFVASSRKDLKSFPHAAQHEIGYQLYLVQLGQEPHDWKPMPSVAPGVCEIRVRAGGAYRAIHIARLAEAVYVLHVFEKRSQKARKGDLELARARFAQVVSARSSRR